MGRISYIEFSSMGVVDLNLVVFRREDICGLFEILVFVFVLLWRAGVGRIRFNCFFFIGYG